MIFSASRSVPYTAYIADVVAGVWYGEVGICVARAAMPVFVLFASSRSCMVFNPNAAAIADHNQSAMDIEPTFKSQLYAEDSGYRKPILILLIG